jgi:hypothetical protein
MLDLWRPPQGAGDPVGCLATTYTFTPGLFDEHCLGRFLGIESDPSREDLAYLLERESLLGAIYAGILVDHTAAGVEHSLRWDVLPVRLRAGKQHAKLSLLSWARHIRIIVSSANLTEPGYRTNYEVASAVDLTPGENNSELLGQAISFLRSLIQLVPGASGRPSHVIRAEAFLEQIGRQTKGWNESRRKRRVRQQLLCTLPGMGKDQPPRSALDEALQLCRGRGGAPNRIWVASPFFDSDDEAGRVVASLCKRMSRRGGREVFFSVPALRGDGNTATVPRLAAPKTLMIVPKSYNAEVSVEILPEMDPDKNRRQWHAKLVAFVTDPYFALMVGSSNLTCAGMGVSSFRNAEANLITLVDKYEYGREEGQLGAVWPKTEPLEDPESAEWLGAQPENEEEEQKAFFPLPVGFLSATYKAGDEKLIILCLDPHNLPEDWSIQACGKEKRILLAALDWEERQKPATIELEWPFAQPPEKLLVHWNDHGVFWAINVEDPKRLPAPEQLEKMSADDMLQILAASDPSAAYRIWSRKQRPENPFDADLDSGTPIDLDPLRRYNLQDTFLHRIRHRARILAQLRFNLQRPVWGRLALDWKLRGPVGIDALAGRLVREFENAGSRAGEALLTLADYLLVLRDVDYQHVEGSVSKPEFDGIFRPFLRGLAEKLQQTVEIHRARVTEDLMAFWNRVVERSRQ